jgi:spore maturation protein CgeB
MSFRFIRITDNYPQFIENFYSKHPQLTQQSYNQQYSSLVQNSFETASSYVKNLTKIGVDAHGIISNATELQNTWKKEHNLPADISKQNLILHQLKHYKPEVVWIDDFSIIDTSWKNSLLKEVPSIKLLLGHICAPYNQVTAEKFKLFDIIFTCIPCQQKELVQQGVNAHLMYHGFEATALDNINKNNRFSESRFLFSGSLYAGSGFHKTRLEYIEAMLKAGIEMDLYCNLESQSKLMAKKGMYYLINSLNKLQLGSVIENVAVLKKNKNYGNTPIHFYSKKLLKSSKAPVFGYEMYQLLSKAKICFNIHGEVAEKCAGNIRLFEATGLSSCLVTDWKDNITDLFVPDKEIVTYKSIDECIEKVKWLNAHPTERDAIAKAGQKRTLKEHTFENRCIALEKIISGELSKK